METLNIIISLVALIFAGLALWRTWSLSKSQAELIKRQLLAQGKATIKVNLVRGVKGVRFVLNNKGNAPAKQLNFSLKIPEGKRSPFSSDYQETFPVKTLHPDESISVLAGLCNDTGTQFGYIAEWENPDKTKEVKEGTVSLNN